MADQKRTDDVDWEDLRFFLALARHGSLSATARALRVNHATVSRRIQALEAALGQSLFDRRADGYALTAEGVAILDEAAPMEEAALAVLRRLDHAADGLEGLVRLTTTRPFADAFLVPRLGEMHRRHPGIDLELVTETRFLSLSRREADIALRFGSLKDSSLSARHIAVVGHGFFANADWAARLAAGAPPVLVDFDLDSLTIPEPAWMAREFPQHRRSFRSNSWRSQGAAVQEGFGIALLPRYVAAALPGLHEVELGKTPPGRDLWMVVRPDLRSVPRVRAVVEALLALLRDHRAVLA